MDNQIKVSVIIPVYNGKKFLENCLNILKNQDFEYKFEIILVNDASTDNFENYSKNINIDNLKIYNFVKNRGQSAARNFGVQKSSGKYIFFMDVDDLISKNSLSSLYKFTLEDDYDYIFSDFQRIEDFQNQRVNKYNYDSDYVFSRNDIVKGMERELYDPTLGHLGLFGCNGRLIKRKIIIDNNILFEENIRWLEDKTFAWDVLKYVKKAKYIRKQLYSYYVNPNVKSAIIDRLILMVCTSQYPCSLVDANIYRIRSLEQLGFTIGFSNHVIEEEAALSAAALGACVFEFHFTDTHDGKEFHDHLLSFTPLQSMGVISSIKKIKSSLGKNTIERTATEEANYLMLRKGLVYSESMDIGATIKLENINYARPAIYFKANEIESVLNKKVIKKVSKGDLITPGDFL